MAFKMYGISFFVDFEKEVLKIDFDNFPFFYRGETKMSESMASELQIQLLKILESKFGVFGWCRSDKLWKRVYEENHFKYYDLKLKKSVFLWDTLNKEDFSSKIRYLMNSFCNSRAIDSNDKFIKYVFDKNKIID